MKCTDTDASKYVRTLGSHRGAEGRRRWKRLLVDFLSSSGNASSRRTLVHACAGVSLSKRRAAAGVDAPAPKGGESDRSPPCFLRGVSFTGANPYSAGHATTHSGTVPMNGWGQTQELQLRGRATTRSGTVTMNGREQTQELRLSKAPPTHARFLTSTRNDDVLEWFRRNVRSHR